MKIAVIVQRYGTEITGGSEHLCRMIAERLSGRHEIDVLTTCARDYISWKNEYPAGRSTMNGITVYRFRTQKTRDLDSFNRLSEKIYSSEHSREDELKWLEEQGPYCPELIDFLQSMQKAYDRLLFFTYLYYPTFHGLQVVPQKSILVPTAHNEPAIKLGIYKEVFSRPYALIYNTRGEMEFANSIFPLNQTQQVAGVGVHLPREIDRRVFRRKQGLAEDYFYYGGRIDAGKGCQELIEYYLKLKETRRDLPLLMLSGHLSMELPSDPSVIYLGYLSEQEKGEALQGASIVFVPSIMESLSLLLLESFAAGTPVMVRENSPVLKEHCVKSNAGLYYNDYDEFRACVEYLLERPHLRHILGKNGQKYVQKFYTWPRVISVYEQMLCLRENATL